MVFLPFRFPDVSVAADVVIGGEVIGKELTGEVMGKAISEDAAMMGAGKGELVVGGDESAVEILLQTSFSPTLNQGALNFSAKAWSGQTGL